MSETDTAANPLVIPQPNFEEGSPMSGRVPSPAPEDPQAAPIRPPMQQPDPRPHATIATPVGHGGGDDQHVQQILPASPGGPSTKLYEYRTAVLQDASALAVELCETAAYYYIVLELAGVSSIAELKIKCERTTTGFEILVECTKSSVIKEPILNSAASTRKLGSISWHAHLQGVFESSPACNLRDGILKMRFKKREAKDAVVSIVDF